MLEVLTVTIATFLIAHLSVIVLSEHEAENKRYFFYHSDKYINFIGSWHSYHISASQKSKIKIYIKDDTIRLPLDLIKFEAIFCFDNYEHDVRYLLRKAIEAYVDIVKCSDEKYNVKQRNEIIDFIYSNFEVKVGKYEDSRAWDKILHPKKQYLKPLKIFTEK